MLLNHKIGLGSVQFGLNYGISNSSGQTPFEEVEKILNFAFSNNIHLIDTASAYGSAEKILGKFNKNRFKIVSKFLPPNLNESVKIQFNQSLKDLQTNALYGYLAHRPLNLLENKNIWKDLLELKDQKKIEKIGYSLNESEEYYALKNAGMAPDLVQVPFNYFDKRFLNIMEELKDDGCEIHSRSTFLQGLFFMDPAGLSEYFDEIKLALVDLQLKYKDQLHGVLLKYVIENKYIDKVIVGTENLSQLQSNLKAMANAPIIKANNFNFSDSILVPSKWPQK